MPSTTDLDRGPGPEADFGASRTLRIRLAFGKVLWRVTLVSLVLLELYVLAKVRNRVRRRIGMVLFLVFYTPRMAFYAFLIGTVVAILADLLVRLVVQPAVRAWYHPRTDDSAHAFHFAPGETVLASTPARRARGLGWQAGDLVRTDRGAWYFPQSWDSEPWFLPIGRAEAVETLAAQRAAWGFLAGVPDRVRIAGAGRGTAETFAVADPAAVLAWFRPEGTSGLA